MLLQNYVMNFLFKEVSKKLKGKWLIFPNL